MKGALPFRAGLHVVPPLVCVPDEEEHPLISQGRSYFALIGSGCDLLSRPRAHGEFEISLWNETICPKCHHSMTDHSARNKLETLHQLLEGKTLDLAKMPYIWMNCTACKLGVCRLSTSEGMNVLLEEARRRGWRSS